MLTDADGHIFTITGQNAGWVYGIIEHDSESEIKLTTLVHHFDKNGLHTYPSSYLIASFNKEDQQYIKDWVAKHPSNEPGLPPPSPPLAPTGLAWSLDQQVVAFVDTSGVLKGRTITATASGFGFSLALCSDGALVAWGDNVVGQLGNGQHGVGQDHPNTLCYAISPVLVHRPGAFKDKTITAIAAADKASYALCSDGSLYIWGGVDQELHKPAKQPVDEPTLFEAGALKGRKIITLAPSGNYALCSDGALIGWGKGPSLWESGYDGAHTDPVVLDKRKLLAGKTITTLTARAILCSDGTLAVWQTTKPTFGKPNWEQLYLVKMDGVLEGKKITAIAIQDNILQVLCSDGTLVALGGLTEPLPTNLLSKTAPNKQAPSPDPASTIISSEDVTFDSNVHPPRIVSGTGALKGKTVTKLDGSLIQCSDGTAVYWNHVLGLPQRLDYSGALRSKTILAASSTSIEVPTVLFKEADDAQPAPTPTAVNP